MCSVLLTLRYTLVKCQEWVLLLTLSQKRLVQSLYFTLVWNMFKVIFFFILSFWFSSQEHYQQNEIINEYTQDSLQSNMIWLFNFNSWILWIYSFPKYIDTSNAPSSKTVSSISYNCQKMNKSLYMRFSPTNHNWTSTSEDPEWDLWYTKETVSCWNYDTVNLPRRGWKWRKQSKHVYLYVSISKRILNKLTLKALVLNTVSYVWRKV